jgi:hypothetical protein
LLPRERVPLDWVRAQDDLGFALWRLGERESGTEKLEEAVATFREVLKALTRERTPLDWARTELGLGLVLWRLGGRESGTTKLEEAVVAYREALKELTRERVPFDWAMAEHSLGTALGDLGKRGSGTAKFEEAIIAYREALKERTRERVPLDWATTQNNLGVAFASLGGPASGTAKLEEAVIAYRLWASSRRERSRRKTGTCCRDNVGRSTARCHCSVGASSLRRGACYQHHQLAIRVMSCIKCASRENTPACCGVGNTAALLVDWNTSRFRKMTVAFTVRATGKCSRCMNQSRMPNLSGVVPFCALTATHLESCASASRVPREIVALYPLPPLDNMCDKVVGYIPYKHQKAFEGGDAPCQEISAENGR